MNGLPITLVGLEGARCVVGGGGQVAVRVGVSFAAYAMFSLAFVAAVTYLLQLRSLKHPGRWLWARQLPPWKRWRTCSDGQPSSAWC